MPYVMKVELYGERKGLQAGIEVLLEVKFGPEGLKLLPEIRRLTDVEVLRSVLQAIKTAASPDELRRIWS